ncbi:hypothetical protein F5Y00DRAFT_59658 [Daldinia vernicosa]|uniref:uncharacterized protein n=1 Tax=Daldinia vernicosa TaxID=114800 RepID=UPI002007E7E5|nr:uncharacterized protein F5Y00DRAFT_59658 [Daldinia vernicosa]KAI0853771.1 hypothetical protein F5Y00DRAFT_59658 [Daldinia vernicosa]
MSLASPVSKDGFSYAGDLFAEASGHNRHRRATVAELKDHFKSGSEKDHPAHWFEAQLIHYGLQVSKTKAVARMRLFDAVNAGNLSIPAHIQKVESELKKEWIKKEREAKKAFKSAATSSPAPKATGAKRKAESSSVDVTVSVGGINVTVSASNSNKKIKSPAKPAATPAPPKAAKKTEAKPKAPKAAATPKAASTTTTSKTTASKTTVSKTTVSKTTTIKTTAAKPPLTGRMARRGGIHSGLSRESSAATSTASTPQPARTPQFALRGRGRGGSSNSPSPVKREYSYNDDDDVKYEDSDDGEDLKPLGLLNGRYALTSDFVTSEWGHINLSLVFTLSGTELWGRFDLGIVSGIMRLPQRPWQSSTEPLNFTWRGQELEGPMMYGDSNRGWIRFLGGGKVEGELDFMGITFEGSRVVGQGTRSEVDISSMRTEWEGYNEGGYERESRSRW